ncbi:hypothetical protein ACTFIU_010092 [Dictyostelium citrinum]
MSKRNSGVDPPKLNESGDGDGSCSENNQHKCSNKPIDPKFFLLSSGSAPLNDRSNQHNNQQSHIEEIINQKKKAQGEVEYETLLQIKENFQLISESPNQTESQESDSDETTTTTTTTTTKVNSAIELETSEENNIARRFWNSVPHNPPPQPPPPLPTITRYSTTTKTFSSIETQTGIEMVQLITTTTKIITIQPYTIPISSLNRIENYNYYLTNDIYKDLKELWRFFKDNQHFNKGRDRDFLVNLKDFIGKFHQYIIANENNRNQQDLGISDCETTLTFCKNLKVDSATLRIRLEKLKINLIYVRFIISNNPQPIGNP